MFFILCIIYLRILFKKLIRVLKNDPDWEFIYLEFLWQCRSYVSSAKEALVRFAPEFCLMTGDNQLEFDHQPVSEMLIM